MCQPVTALQAIDGWWLPALCLIFCSSWWQPFLSNLPDQHCHNGLWQCSNAGLPAQMHIYSFCWQKLNSFFRIHKIAPYKMSWGKFSTTVNGVVLRTNHWEKTLCDKSFSNSNVLFPGKEKIFKKKKITTQRNQITYVHQKICCPSEFSESISVFEFKFLMLCLHL